MDTRRTTRPRTEYGYFSSISVERINLSPRAAAKIAFSEILAARIRILARENARKARARAAEEMGR
jgi:hypothetical protein